MPAYPLQVPARWKSWGSVLLVITPATFHRHLDKHLAVCQHERHHDDDCHATCILSEMMPEQSEVPAERIARSFHFDLVIE